MNTTPVKDIVSDAEPDENLSTPISDLILLKQLNEFANNASIHGVRYMTQPYSTKPFIRHLYWAIIFLVSAIATGYFLYGRYTAWVQDRFVTKPDDSHIHAWKIAFPAVTICTPFITTDVDIFQKIHSNFAHNLNSTEFDNESKMFINAFAQICNKNERSTIESGLNDEKMWTSYFTDFVPEIDDIMEDCDFGGINKKCSDFFTKSLIEHGTCYTFNSLRRDDLYLPEIKSKQKSRLKWNPDSSYDNHSDLKNSYPYRMFDINTKFTVKIKLDNILSGYPGCSSDFSFVFHSPAELPNQIEDVTTTPQNKYYSFKIAPQITWSMDLEGFSPKKRECYYTKKINGKDDRRPPLEYFQMYSEENCYLECLAKYVVRKCQCIPFHLIQLNKDRSTICKNSKCYTDTIKDFNEFRNFIDDENIIEKCDCKPNCNNINYKIKYDEKDFSEEDKEIENISKFEFEFQDFKFQKYVRSEKSDLTEFIAEFGGLLGLHLGISLFSFVEFIYYFVIGVIKDRKRLKKT